LPIHTGYGLRGKSPTTPLSAVAGLVGSPEQAADELIAWVEETDVDGFNLAYAVMPETFADFVDLVVPELQRRGRYKLDYASGTLREKLYGPGRARLVADHPAARFRGTTAE
jgi:alkanesulfonate monooxygenase